MFDDIKLDMKFLYRIIVVVISILAIIFSFINNRYAYAYLHTYNAILTLPIFIVMIKLTADKLFKNNDYQTVTFNLIYFCLVILNIVTFVIGMLFMEYKFWMKEFYTIDNIFGVIVLPLLVVLDFIFFVDKGLYKMYFVPYSLIPFSLYILTMIIRSLIVRGNTSISTLYWQKYYPYVFFNFDNMSLVLIIVNILCLLIGTISLAFGCYLAKCKKYDISVDD